MAKSNCSCPGAGHDPFKCKSTEDLCRVSIFGGGQICGLPKGHDQGTPNAAKHGPANPKWAKQ